jgi:hypothetical protein
MTMRPLAILSLGVLVGCGASQNETSAPRVTADSDQLTQCFAESYDAADKDAAFAKCEQKHFGTAWRDKAKPRAGATLGSGNLDPMIIKAAIDARLPRVRACYTTALRKDPTLRGELKFKFVIDTSGRAIDVVDAGSRMKDKDVVHCALKEFMALRFPVPEGGIVEVLYPLVVSPGDTATSSF